MNEPELTNRRTVLKTLTATTVGGGVLTGTASGERGEPRGSREAARGHTNRVAISAHHDDEAGDHVFELSTDKVAPGWTTFEFDNESEHTHFAYLAKLPQAAIDDADGGDLLDFYVEHVTRPFQYFMDTLVSDKEPDPNDLSDRYTTEDAIFPPWFGSVLPSGGVGLTSDGRTSVSTVDLDPGEYMMECYVKDDEEAFHSYHGMVEHLTVTEDGAGAPNPAMEATLDVSLSTAGIDAADAVPPGQHTVAVRIENQQVYANLIGHNLHLVRLDGDTTASDVSGWMNWMAPDQLVSDGDEPGPFVGGVQTILTPSLLEGTGSETAYMHANLDPGDYAWVSEVPTPMDKGFLQEFTVTESAPRGRTPPADPGDSRNWGAVGEHPDDDLSAQPANSAMPDDVKTIFDTLANYDLKHFD